MKILVAAILLVTSFEAYAQDLASVIEGYRRQLTSTSSRIQYNLSIIDRNLEHCTMHYERVRDQFIAQIGTQVRFHATSIQAAVDAMYSTRFCDPRAWTGGTKATNDAIRAIASGLQQIAASERDYNLGNRISTDCNRVLRDRNQIARIEREQKLNYAGVKTGLSEMRTQLQGLQVFFQQYSSYRCNAGSMRAEMRAQFFGGRSFFPVNWGQRRR